MQFLQTPACENLMKDETDYKDMDRNGDSFE